MVACQRLYHGADGWVFLTTLKKQYVLRFRGREIEATTGPETASGRDWAARGSWEAPGVNFEAIKKKTIRKGVPKPAVF